MERTPSGVFQFNIVFGIPVACLSNYLIGLVGLGGSEWHWKFAVAAVPAALLLAMLFGIPRSPRWLVEKGRIEEARAVIKLIGEQDVEATLCTMVAAKTWKFSMAGNACSQPAIVYPYFWLFRLRCLTNFPALTPYSTI